MHVFACAFVVAFSLFCCDVYDVQYFYWAFVCDNDGDGVDDDYIMGVMAVWYCVMEHHQRRKHYVFFFLHRLLLTPLFLSSWW